MKKKILSGVATRAKTHNERNKKISGGIAKTNSPLQQGPRGGMYKVVNGKKVYTGGGQSRAVKTPSGWDRGPSRAKK